MNRKVKIVQSYYATTTTNKNMSKPSKRLFHICYYVNNNVLTLNTRKKKYRAQPCNLKTPTSQSCTIAPYNFRQKVFSKHYDDNILPDTKSIHIYIYIISTQSVRTRARVSLCTIIALAHNIFRDYII